MGASHQEALWIAGLSSLDSIVCGMVAVLTIDRYGRKPFLFFGSLIQVAMFVIIAVLLGTSPPKNHAYGAAAVVMLFVYYGVNAACWLGVSWA
jgi:MFS family permease